jgi:PAS domain S-box-containing protein
MSESREDIPEIAAPDIEPGMNFISADFDLVMVNRANERLYGKPATALLGKKCYREFERRDEPCPHCPGRLSLATGETHETETMGLRDNGTRFYARIRTHPVVGPDNKPTGFIEVVEDITEQKLAESLAHIETDLQLALVSAKNVQKALREVLDAALRVQDVDWGCVFLVDHETAEQELVFQRGVPDDDVGMLAAVGRGQSVVLPTGVRGEPPVLEVVPILHKEERVASLVVGSAGGHEIAPSAKAALRSMGAITGNAVSRIRAEQSRGDAVADLEAFIAIAPVAAWVIDRGGRITMWNKAAEKLLGWRAAEILGRAQPFEPVSPEQDLAVLTGKDGQPVNVRLLVAPFRDIVGNSSATIILAEDLTLQRRLAQLEERLAQLEASSGVPAGAKGSEAGPDPARSAARVLVVDSGQPWGQELAGILSGLGYAPVRCASIDETAAILADAAVGGLPVVLTVVDLVTPTGSSGLSQSTALRELGLRAPVLVSSDADVLGYEQYNIAGALRYPFDTEAVGRVIRQVLSPRE